MNSELILVVDRTVEDLGYSKGEEIEWVGQRICFRESAYRQVFEALSNMIRNSIDHSFGSDISGVISIESTVFNNGVVQIRYYDNGKGLAMNRLRQIALDKSTLRDLKSNQKVAELIFSKGTSTASKIKAISGRSLGTKAAQALFVELGGGIEIRLTKPEEINGFQKIEFIITFRHDLALNYPAFEYAA